MNINNFVYDGICVHERYGIAPYTVEFIKWTDDPGIFLGKCSDGKDRLIPSCQVVHINPLPPMPSYAALKRKMKKANILIHVGTPSSSE